MLSPYGNEKVDLMNIVNAKYTRELDDIHSEVLSKYLRRFLAVELLPFDANQIE